MEFLFKFLKTGKQNKAKKNFFKSQSPTFHENLKNMSQAWLYVVIQEQLFLSNSICGYSYSIISMTLIFSLTPLQSALS